MERSAISNSSSKNTRGAERSTHDDDEEEEEEDAPEESGWTIYFDDFFSNNNREILLQNDASSSSCFSGSPSLVSDAASIAAWNKLSSNVVGQSPIVRTDKVTSKKLRLLKKKKKGIVRGGVMDIEDALEDTASSPVNSPKVSSDHHMMKQFDHLMNTPRKNDNDHTSCSSSSLRNKQLGGGGVSAGHFSEMQTDERNPHPHPHHHFLAGGGGGGQGFNGRENECTELKKKGLCLVPMSMLVNYFG